MDPYMHAVGIEPTGNEERDQAEDEQENDHRDPFSLATPQTATHISIASHRTRKRFQALD